MKLPKPTSFKTKVPKPRTKPTGIGSSFGSSSPSMFGGKKNYAKNQPQDPMTAFGGGFGDLGLREVGGSLFEGFK